jgi:hypothetical protein
MGGHLTVMQRRGDVVVYLAGADIDDRKLGLLAPQLEALPRLVTLSLRGTQVTDDGLGHLRALNSLHFLDLTNTRVTHGGVSGLSTALPKCRIHHGKTWPPNVTSEWFEKKQIQ